MLKDNSSARDNKRATRPMEIPADIWSHIGATIRGTADALDEEFPYITDPQGTWKCLPVDQYAGWTGKNWNHGNWFCGFWVGLLWLAFEVSAEPYFLEEARRWAERMRFRQHDPNSHDIGFLFIPSFVKGFLLTGESTWREPALAAAQVLAGRVDDRAGIVQAWGKLDDSRTQGSSTIDTMMNLPLLWWAAGETGDVSFSRAAARHARVSAAVYIREDGSTFHTARFDPVTGVLMDRGTYQGLSQLSCWSRGLAWAISGFSEAYRHTGAPELLEAAETVSEYYFDHAPEDLVPYWDYQDPGIPGVPRDSAAAAIAAGGFLTLADVHPQDRLRQEYERRARRVLGSLLEGYLNRDPGGSYQGILRHACYSKPHDEGVDGSFIVGDFFLVQNLLRAARETAAAGSPFSGGVTP